MKYAFVYILILSNLIALPQTARYQFSEDIFDNMAKDTAVQKYDQAACDLADIGDSLAVGVPAHRFVFRICHVIFILCNSILSQLFKCCAAQLGTKYEMI